MPYHSNYQRESVNELLIQGVNELLIQKCKRTPDTWQLDIKK